MKDLSSSLVCFLALVRYSEALRAFGCEIFALIFFFPPRQEPLPVCIWDFAKIGV